MENGEWRMENLLDFDRGENGELRMENSLDVDSGEVVQFRRALIEKEEFTGP